MERKGERLETLPDAPESPAQNAKTADAVAAMEVRLHDLGPKGALEFLNARTRYRFTGIYHAEPPLLRNLFLFDRENPSLHVTAGTVSPLDDTYCGIVVSHVEEFATNDAGLDPRLTKHAARESVVSYAGVPLRLDSGRAWGTLCHFDDRPRLLLDSELAVMQGAAPVFMCWLRDHRLATATGTGTGA